MKCDARLTAAHPHLSFTRPRHLLLSASEAPPSSTCAAKASGVPSAVRASGGGTTSSLQYARGELDEARPGEQTSVEHGEGHPADVGRFEDGSGESLGTVAVDGDAIARHDGRMVSSRSAYLRRCRPRKSRRALRAPHRHDP